MPVPPLSRGPGGVFANALLALILAVAIGAGVIGVNRIAAPAARILPPEHSAKSIDYASLIEDVTATELRRHFDAFRAAGPRFSGTAGCDRAADHIADVLAEAGFEVVEQPFTMTVPVTKRAHILDEKGRPFDGIRIFPFLPNAFRTPTTPRDGLRGKVLRGREGLSREFEDVALDGQIVLLPLGKPWNVVAGMGARAVFYYDDGSVTPAASWSHRVHASLNVPRFLVEGDIQALEGKTITLKARVDFKPVTARNIIGFLASDASADEAVVLNAYYDAYSYVPDRAVGADQSTGASVLLSLARHLGRVTTGRDRSVVLVFTSGHGEGLAGARQFVRVLGDADDRTAAVTRTTDDRTNAADDLEQIGKALEVARDQEYWAIARDEAESAYWVARPAPVRAAFEDSLKRVMDQDFMAALEREQQARLAWVRDGRGVHDPEGSPLTSFAAFRAARVEKDAARALMSMPPPRLKRDETNGGYRHRIDERRVQERLARFLLERSDVARDELTRATINADLAKRLGAYRRVLFLGLDLTSASGRIGLVCGEAPIVPRCMPADAEVATQFLLAGDGLDRADTSGSHRKTEAGRPRFENLLRKRDIQDLPFPTLYYYRDWGSGEALYFESSASLWAGHPSFAVVTLDDSRRHLGTPHDTFDRMLPRGGADRTLERLQTVARLIGAATRQLAAGHGRIVPTTHRGDQAGGIMDLRGRVVSQLGDDLTPSHGMPGAIVRLVALDTDCVSRVVPPGVGHELWTTADVHGRFEVPRLWPTALSRRWHRQFTIETGVVRPEDGAITWMLSEPLSGRPRFDTVGGPYAVQREPFKTFRRSPATAVVFRAAPVQVFPMVDPTTMRRYRKLALLDAETMAEPRSFFVEIPIPQDSLVCYVPPETRLHLAFRRIAANQPRLQLGAVAMNAGEPIDDAAAQRATDDVGPGYLAADTPSIKNLELDAAMSMARLNAGRVRLQERHGMADEMVSAYSHKALALAEEAEAKAARGRIAEAKRTALHSIAYGSNIYPVIRQNASDAVVGILFYLFLAVPFAFYMEKLLIGQTDVRFQVLWQLVIFLVFFLLLRMVHPAYELVRNSYMILLGFLTFALALVVGTYVSHKFARNVGALTRSMHRQIETVDVSRAGAAATAFLLGLNNMRKRPVRTGLTVATLILITFVMICFTSVRSDVVDLQLPVGKASYTGLLIRDRALRDVSGALAETREAYGDRHVVAERSWGGNFATALDEIPELAIYAISRSADGRTYEAVANAVLGLTALEPRVTPIDKAFPVLKRWFDRDTEQVCMLPRTLADRLRIADEQVLDGTVKVKIGGLDYAVLGIFDESRLDALLDLDGQPILPVDLPSVQDPWQLGTGVTRTERTELPEDVPRLPAAQVLITTTGSMPEKTKVASVAVALRDMPYTEARKLILSQLERSGKPLYYGLDDVAYFGGKFRHRSIEGLVDLLLPIVVVAFTVLNTMCGSVYDRQDELYVFNAVGLAPAHIRFLFMAEASVYAVVGAVGGYLLAQAVATSVKAMGLEAGLTMNYSSLSAVLVSIVIMVVVLLSTVFPARMAARLAAPSSTATRQRHTAEGDVIELDLPFIFNQRDRVAIIAYFADWLENHGEGSSGAFYCSAPEVGIGAEPDGDLFPFIRTMTWLKPYDLGVSQRVELMVRHDPKTGGNVPIVAMTCRSGDRESWQRCCHAFIGRLRKRLLTWRAVGHEDRDRLLERGREMLGGVPSAPSPQDALNS